MKTPTIGILAGMGPRSTAPFVDEVVNQCQKLYGAVYDIDFPPMMIYSLPTPFYIDRPLDHGGMENAITDGLKKLEDIGVSFIVMPCNTAHLYFQELQASISVPLLHIVKETAKHLEGQKTSTILATRMVIESELYQSGIKRIDCPIILKDEWQSTVDHLIQRVKAGEATEPFWNDLLESISNEGVSQIVMACTDLSMLPIVPDYEFQKVDSAEKLAIATIQKYLKLKDQQ